MAYQRHPLIKKSNEGLPTARAGDLNRGQTSQLLLKIYQRLYCRYGPQGWWPGEGALDVVIGAILTQSTAWSNVEQALLRLKGAGCWSLESIHQCPQEELAAIIRPSGYYNAKAKKLKAFAAYVYQNYDGKLAQMLSGELATLRKELLSIHGIGPETSDDILLYAGGKPSFVIDAYTRRIIQRVGLVTEEQRIGYLALQAIFHDNLPRDPELFNEYHALLDRHAKETCTKVPQCGKCCLNDLCATGRELAS